MSFDSLSPGSSDSGHVNDDLRRKLAIHNNNNNNNNNNINSSSQENNLTTQKPSTGYHDETFPNNYVMGPASMATTTTQLPYQYHDPAVQEFQYISSPAPVQFIAPHPSPSTVLQDLGSQKSVDYPLGAPLESESKTKEKKKRPRRKFHEVERLYVCNFGECTKAYGTLNHLNSHVQMQNHGSKRYPEEFKAIREIRRQERKRMKHEAKKLGIQQTTERPKSRSVGTIPTSMEFASSSSSSLNSGRLYSTSAIQPPINYQFNPLYNHPGNAQAPSMMGKSPYDNLHEYHTRHLPADPTEEYAGIVSNTTFIPANYNTGLMPSTSRYHNQLSGLQQHSSKQQAHPQQQVKLPMLQEYQELPLTHQLPPQQQHQPPPQYHHQHQQPQHTQQLRPHINPSQHHPYYNPIEEIIPQPYYQQQQQQQPNPQNNHQQ